MNTLTLSILVTCLASVAKATKCTGGKKSGSARECCDTDEDGPCGIGEGDCDGDSECSGDLLCGKDNCDQDTFWSSADCCTVGYCFDIEVLTEYDYVNSITPITYYHYKLTGDDSNTDGQSCSSTAYDNGHTDGCCFNTCGWYHLEFAISNSRSRLRFMPIVGGDPYYSNWVKSASKDFDALLDFDDCFSKKRSEDEGENDLETRAPSSDCIKYQEK